MVTPNPHGHAVFEDERNLATLSDIEALKTWGLAPNYVATLQSGSQIDWLPLDRAGVRPTQGRALAVCQVNAGSQSFNTVNQLRVLGRWMRMNTIPNQSSVANAYDEFDGAGRIRPSSYYDRLVDVMEELVKFTLLTATTPPIWWIATASGSQKGARSRARRISQPPSIRTQPGNRTAPALGRRYLGWMDVTSAFAP